MEKNAWPNFLSTKIRSQITLENTDKIQAWAFTFAGLGALGFALSAMATLAAGNFSPTKILFLIFYSAIVAMLSSQLVFGSEGFEGSGFLMFTAWINFMSALTYLGVFGFSFLSFSFFPSVLIKLSERILKIFPFFPAFHAAVLLLLSLGYLGKTALGSPEFFEHLRVAGLFWIFIAVSVLGIEKILQTSAVPALSALEFDVISGRLERSAAL